MVTKQFPEVKTDLTSEVNQLGLTETEALLEAIKEDQIRCATNDKTVLAHSVTKDGKYIVTIETQDESESKSFIVDGKDLSGERWQPKTTLPIADVIKLRDELHEIVKSLVDLETAKLTPAIKALASVRDRISVSHIPTNELPKPKDCVALEFDPWSIDYE
jgi:hypothetical protein